MPSFSNDSGVSSTVFLRRITILSFPPAFLILLIHGVNCRWAFPALGILPLAVSALLGALLLHRDRVAALGSPIQALSADNIFYADTVLAIWYFAFLIPTWALLHRPSEEEMIILGTYGSVFLMVNFGIHFYFAAAEALHIITTKRSPYQSLAAEYTPLNEEYRDDLAEIEEGNVGRA
ncbi:hypothetical protein Daus18300_002585 [Diaporthe australafricana]|uniref:Uncharacterized protein n=1 Tax=Diaporthe australafricana TaxID=127596 RepID=A0ABR3XLW6_9PEZI